MQNRATFANCLIKRESLLTTSLKFVKIYLHIKRAFIYAFTNF